jgi:CheY-like chemotaxis protein
MAARGWEPDLFGAVAAAAAGVARTLRKDPASAVLFWGDPPEVEVVHQAGLPDDVIRALSAGGGAYLAEAVRRAAEPIRVQSDALPPAADSLGAALRAHELAALALFPLNGETGIVGCLLVPLDAESEIPTNSDGWKAACHALAGLQVVASAAALRVIMEEDRRRPVALCDGVVVVDRWERVLLADGIVRELPGWNRADPFGRSLYQLLGGPLLAKVGVSRPGAVQWEEHVFPPAENHGIPVAVASVPGRLAKGQEDGSRIFLVRDLRPDDDAAMDSTARILALAIRAAHAADEFLKSAVAATDDAGTTQVSSSVPRGYLDEAELVPSLVRSVLWSTVAEGERSRLDLNHAMSGVLDRIRGDLDMERVRVFTFLRPELDPVVAEPLEMLAVLRALVGRARDSLRFGGGTLTVRTWAEDEWVGVAVSDDGAGVPMRESRGFEPLFSAPGETFDKELDQIQVWAKGWGGRFQVERRAGVWNRYALMIPVERREKARAPRAQTSETTVRTDQEGRLEVLVVDDNAALRSVLRRFLERRGHSVVEAVDGDDALGKVSGRAFDKVIVDMRMPGKSGPEFYECLKRVAPEMRERTLFMTGGILEDDIERFIEESGRPAIPKPFDLAQLAKTLEE